MTPCDWASQLFKHPEFHLSNDWLTFLLDIQIMRGGDNSQTFLRNRVVVQVLWCRVKCIGAI